MGISLSGLASGMDTNAMVTALMKLERLPYENLNNIKTDRSQAQTVFQELNVKLLTLKNAAADLNYRANFQTKSITSSDDTVLSGSAAVNAAAGTYQIEVTKLAQAHSVRTNSIVTNGSDIDPDATITFQYNGKSIEIELNGANNEENLNKMATAINNGGLGVRASVIESEPGSKTLVLTSRESGIGNEIEFMPTDPDEVIDGKTYISASDETVLTDLGLKTGGGSINEVRAAQNAEFTIDGLQVQSKSNTSKDIIDGVTLNLSKVGSSTLTIGVDGDKVAEKVEAFVNAYNDVIGMVRANTAKEMALQGDSTLRALESQLNNWFNRAVGEEGGSLRYMFQIGLEIDKGITTGSSMTGTISFDKDKFKEQLAANPDDVYALFSSDLPGDDKDGIAQYFGGMAMNSWTSSVNGIISTRIKGYDSEISTITDQMSQMNDRINAAEARLRKQFAAMETALSQLQSQQQWMASQLAALTSSL